MKNRFEETSYSSEHRFSLGNDTKTGGHYLTIPVSNGVVDYNEQYGITTEQFQLFSTDLGAAVEFVEACRRRDHDDQLNYQPGTNRGTPV
jgi:hypothetical protein